MGKRGQRSVGSLEDHWYGVTLKRIIGTGLLLGRIIGTGLLLRIISKGQGSKGSLVRGYSKGIGTGLLLVHLPRRIIRGSLVRGYSWSINRAKHRCRALV